MLPVTNPLRTAQPCTPLIVCLALVVLGPASVRGAQQPTSRVIAFSGRMPLQPDGPVALRFRLYTAETGGMLAFEEPQTVMVVAESFTARVGDGTVDGVPVDVFRSNPSLWMAFVLTRRRSPQAWPAPWCEPSTICRATWRWRAARM